MRLLPETAKVAKVAKVKLDVAKLSASLHLL